MSTIRAPEATEPAMTIDRMRRLHRIAWVAERVSAAAIVLVFGFALYLATDRPALVAYLMRDVPGVMVEPAGGAIVLSAVLSLLPVGIFVAAMVVARRLFRLLRTSRMFDPSVPLLLARLGGLAMVAAVVGVVMRTLVVLVMTSANPAGQRQLLLGASSDEISALVMGLLFYAFALVMQEAARIEEENQGFV